MREWGRGFGDPRGPAEPPGLEMMGGGGVQVVVPGRVADTLVSVPAVVFSNETFIEGKRYGHNKMFSFLPFHFD